MDPSFPMNNCNTNSTSATAAATKQTQSNVPTNSDIQHSLQQQQQQQQQLMPNMGAANAVQQALAAFQASVEAAAVAASNQVSNVATAPQPAVPQQQQPQLLALQPGQTLFAATPGATAADAQQQLWQQAWLSAILPAQQAALTQPYLAAALNPQQQQQQQQQIQQQLQPQQQQQLHQHMLAALPSTVLNSVLPPVAPAAAAPPTNTATKRKASPDTTTTRPTKKHHHTSGPSVISATSTTKNPPQQMLDNEVQPPTLKTEAELAVMTPAQRRRYERNLREQQRSYKISQQIKQLRDVLHESNIPFRPNKYSILVSVADYIKQLQSRAIMLDSEHQRLIDTIRNTTERVPETTSTTPLNNVVLEADAPLVQGIDYQTVFSHCYFPLAVATLDGRVLRCNKAMETLLRAEPMTDQSFFVFIRNHQEIFEAMAALLKRSTATIETGEGTVTKTGQLLFWCGHILSPSNETFPFTITLTNDAADNPKYFSLSAAASPEI